MASKIQAVLLAGGQGSRLRPYTTVLPKPLLPVGDYPIIEIIIRQLRTHGIKRIAISTGHLAELIEAYLGDGRKWGVRLLYVREDKPLGTAGSLQLVKSLEDNFLVMNGDVLADVDFTKLFKTHRRLKAAATIVCKERIVKTDFGVLEINTNHELVNYMEKPEHRSFVSTGINLLNKKAKTFIRPGESLGMPDLLLRMKHHGLRVSCFNLGGFWLDLGRVDDLEAAQDIFERNKKKFLRS